MSDDLLTRRIERRMKDAGFAPGYHTYVEFGRDDRIQTADNGDGTYTHAITFDPPEILTAGGVPIVPYARHAGIGAEVRPATRGERLRLFVRRWFAR